MPSSLPVRLYNTGTGGVWNPSVIVVHINQLEVRVVYQARPYADLFGQNCDGQNARKAMLLHPSIEK